MIADDGTSCPRCSAPHQLFACPHVKAIDIGDEGNIVRVEFLTPMDFRQEPSRPIEDGDKYPKLGASNAKNQDGDGS